MALEENIHQENPTPIGSSNLEQNNATNQSVVEVAIETNPENPPSKRQRSIVWEHFEKITVNGVKKAKCNHCKKLLGGESRNGTTHLRDHMGSCKFRNQQDIRQKIMTSNLKSELSTYMFNEKDGRNDLAKMVVLHEYPLSIVDHVGFKTYSKTLQPLFKVPCRNTLKSDIIKLYEHEKKQVIKNLETIQSRVAITTDMWTSNQKKGFMVITGHYIDNDWILQSKILRFLYVPCPHTSEVLTNVLMDALMEWNVETKLSTITVDNCSTNDSLIEFQRYLDEGIEPQSQNFDILLWWKLRAAKYPILQAIARDVLAIPVSTVASESAFSASGRLISPHRSRLHPDTIEALMCAQSWLWEIINKDEDTPFISDDNATIFDDSDF